MTYEEQLLTREWKEKRAEIIDRDMGMCQHCMTSKNLQVHHKYYEAGQMAWEYPSIALITLCDSCHKNAHSGDVIGSSLDRALARLITVAQGMRQYSVERYLINKENG